MYVHMYLPYLHACHLMYLPYTCYLYISVTFTNLPSLQTIYIFIPAIFTNPDQLGNVSSFPKSLEKHVPHIPDFHQSVRVKILLQLKVSFFHPFVRNFFIFLPLGQNPSEAEIQDMVNTVDKVPTAIIYHTLYQCSEAEIQDMVNTVAKVHTAIIYHTLYHCSEAEIQDVVNTVDKVHNALIYHTLYTTVARQRYRTW